MERADTMKETMIIRELCSALNVKEEDILKTIEKMKRETS